MFATPQIQSAITAPKADILGQLKLMIAVHNQRKALAKMDAAQMKDLGLSEAVVTAEIARPFWDF